MQSDFVVPSIVLVDLSQNVTPNDFLESSSLKNLKQKSGLTLQDKAMSIEGSSTLPQLPMTLTHHEKCADGYFTSRTIRDFGFHLEDFSFDVDYCLGNIDNYLNDSCQENPNFANDCGQKHFLAKSGVIKSVSMHLPLGRPLAPPPRLPKMIFTNNSSKRKLDAEINIGEGGRRVRIKC
jgi:hypothetical protein